MADRQVPGPRGQPTPPGGGSRRVRRGTSADGAAWEEVREEWSTGGPRPNFPPPSSFRASGSSDDFFSDFQRRVDQMRHRQPMQQRRQPPPAPPVAEIEVSLDEAYSGCARQITLPDRRRWEVYVPAGIDDGMSLRLPPGLVRIRVRRDPRFGRQGRDLSTATTVEPSLLEQGGDVQVPLAGGGWIRVRVPAGTPADARLRVAGRGMPDVHGGGPGDLYIHLRAAH